MKKKGQITRRISPFALALGVCLVLYAVSLCVPLLWAFMTSFKLQSDFRLNVLGFPDPPAWNYSFVLSQFKVPVTTEAGVTEITMGRMYVYTIAYAAAARFSTRWCRASPPTAAHGLTKSCPRYCTRPISSP